MSFPTKLIIHRIDTANSVVGIGLIRPENQYDEGNNIAAYKYCAVELCAAEYIQDLTDRTGDCLVNYLQSIAHSLISVFPGKTFLISSGGEPRTRSRVRTYKGIYGTKEALRHSRVIQDEISVGSQSILAAATVVNKSDLDEAIEISWDFVRNCFCLFGEDMRDEEVFAFATKCIRHTDGCFDFPCLTETVCGRGGYILRLSRSQRVSLTVIGRSENELNLRKLVKGASKRYE